MLEFYSSSEICKSTCAPQLNLEVRRDQWGGGREPVTPSDFE